MCEIDSLNVILPLLANVLMFATAVVSLLCLLIEKIRQHTNDEREKSEPPKAE